MAGKAIVCVTNDLCTDQRVHKTCMALGKCGFEVIEYGRILPSSFPLERAHTTLRKKHIFNRGPLFYAEYNIRLFIFLLLNDAILIWANDLDTLPAAFLASKFKKKKLIYDTHEFYTETPELVNRPFIQSIWRKIESAIFPKLSTIITVNDSIAKLYKEKYKKNIDVIRNIPASFNIDVPKTRKELGLPEDKKILIIQGAGINIDRGAEEACLAMQHLEDCILLIIGSGDVIPMLKKMTSELGLESRIIFRNKMDFKELRHYTMCADIGLAIDKDTNINYRYSLPNKLFDYLHAGIPVLTSGLPELDKILDHYDAGYKIRNHDPQQIADVIKNIFNSYDEYKVKKFNASQAGKKLRWENEEKKLINIIRIINDEIHN